MGRRGYVPRPAETTREFALRVEQAAPQVQGLFVELIDRYYTARFGGAAQAHAGKQLSQQVLARLRNGHGNRTYTRETTARPLAS